MIGFDFVIESGLDYSKFEIVVYRDAVCYRRLYRHSPLRSLNFGFLGLFCVSCFTS